jgi:hypothetical protein
MVIPKAQEQLIRVAVEVLQTQDPRSVSILKNFLAFDPSPTAIREILSSAVTELVDTAPAAVCWLLKYPEHLQPEVNVSYLVSQTLLQRLITLGFSQGQSFTLEDDRIFEISETAKAALLTHSQSLKIQSPLEVVNYFESK